MFFCFYCIFMIKECLNTDLLYLICFKRHLDQIREQKNITKVSEIIMKTGILMSYSERSQF